MRWNASFLALLLPLAGCGGGWGFQDAPAAELPPAPQQNPYPAAGYAPQADSYERPSVGADRPGAPYAAPGAGYSASAARAPGPAASYPAPVQDYSPQVGEWRDPAATANGPAGSSRHGPDDERYDQVGYAGMRGVQGSSPADAAVVAVHPTLPAGTIVEVTSIDSGRTILVLITGQMAGGAGTIIDLSPGAVRQLGATGSSIPVRVRKVAASGQDEAALRSGRPATPRAEAPPALLAGLRRNLPSAPFAAAPMPASPTYSAPAYTRPAAPVRSNPAQQSGYVVQLAALSNKSKAQSIANQMGGFVQAGGGLYRIRLGPYATSREAEAARAQAARAGYGDARVFSQ